MDAARRTSGALAHELNNYLGAIRTMAYLLGESLPEGSPEAEDLAGLLLAVDGAEALSGELRAFAHAAPLEPGSVDLNAVVREAAAAVQAGSRREVQVRTTLADGVPPVPGTEAQLRAIVEALLASAVERVDVKGLVEVVTRDGPTASLEVRDSGTAIPAEQLGRVFEPFVASKGHQLGLKLPQIYRTLSQSGGRIAVTSSREGGTMVRLMFPALPAPTEETGT